MAKPGSFLTKAPYHNLVYFLQAVKTCHKCFGVSGPCSIRLKYPIQVGVPSHHYCKDFEQLLDKTHSSTLTVSTLPVIHLTRQGCQSREGRLFKQPHVSPLNPGMCAYFMRT